MNPIISINTLAYEGYDLTTALQEIAKIGVSHVELGFTRGWTEGLTEAHFSEASAARISRLLSDLGLSSIALSAHIDLTTEESVDEIKRRIDFGKRLGVEIVNTKVGAISGRKKFEQNIKPIAEYAESMNVVIGLENPSEGTDQIITSGKTGAAVIEKIDSNFIKLNYDFGNAFTYSKGAVDPASDYKNAMPHACHLHLKDLKKVGDGWVFSQIGGGAVGYDSIFREFTRDKKIPPMSIEHLFIYIATGNLIVERKEKAPDLDRIRMSLEASYNYVKNFFDS